MKPQELQKLQKSKSPPTVLDVRSGMEYRMGHVPGALLLPFWKVGSMLVKRGYSRIAYLDGDMPGWRQAKLPIEK